MNQTEHAVALTIEFITACAEQDPTIEDPFAHLFTPSGFDACQRLLRAVVRVAADYGPISPQSATEVLLKALERI